MRFSIYILILLLYCQSCYSIRGYNANINTLRPVKQLKRDIDFVQRKLDRLHPELYQFISKEDWNFKMDSLSRSIDKPMTSHNFYFKLSPLLGAIGQGHLRLFPATKRLTLGQYRFYRKNGLTPLAKFGFDTYNGKVYVVQNHSGYDGLQIGDEVLNMDGISVQEIQQKYRPTLQARRKGSRTSMGFG